MGCCFSKKRCKFPQDIYNEEELNRRYNDLLADENNKEKTVFTRDYVKSPSLTSLNRRLYILSRPLEENLDNDIEEKEEDLDNDIESLENRLRALGSNLQGVTTSHFQTLKKKDIAKLRLAEEKLLEFEVRLAELQKPII